METTAVAKEKKPKNPDHLRPMELIPWSTGGIANAMNIMVLGYLQIYCTSMLGLNPLLVGSLLLASRIIDIFTDILVGYMVDKTNTRWGRGRPYTLCVIGTWVCSVLLFSCPAGWETPVKVAWVVSAYVLVNSGFNSIWAAAQTPYMIRAFNNPRKYVSLTSYGGLITMFGAVAVNVSFPILLGTLATSPQGWTTTILIFAVPGTLLGLWKFFAIPEKYHVDVKTDKMVIKDVIRMLKGNKHIYSVAFMMLAFNIAANMGVGVYYYTYIVKNVALMSIASMVSVVMIPVMLIFPPLLKKVTVKDTIFVGFLICAISGIFNWIANDNFVLLLIGQTFWGLGAVPVSMLTGLLIIDCADFNEWKGEHRMEATLGVVPNLTANFGGAIGAFLLGFFLNIGGFISTTEGVEVQQPDSAILMIRLLMSAVPFVLMILAAISVRSYKLDKLLPQIRKENAERRALRAAENVE
jgi:probable glucitol transport protein GutA